MSHRAGSFTPPMFDIRQQRESGGDHTVQRYVGDTRPSEVVSDTEQGEANSDASVPEPVPA